MFALAGTLSGLLESAMGKYQLSRKDGKFNGRYHSQLARDNAAAKVAKAKAEKAARLAAKASASEAGSKAEPLK